MRLRVYILLLLVPAICTGQLRKAWKPSYLTRSDTTFLKQYASVASEWDSTTALKYTKALVAAKMSFSDTASLSSRINAKMAFSDTASLSGRINLKMGYADTASLSARINVKRDPSEYLRVASGLWYGPNHGGMATAPTTQACVANTLRAFPFYVGTSYTIDSVRIEVSTGVAGSRHALAIYEDADGDLYPDNRVLDLGAYTAAGAAVKGDTLTAPLGASTSNGTFTFQANKLYFIGIHSSSTATFRAVAQTSMPHLLGWNSALATNTQYTAWNVTSATYTYPNSCPNPFTAGGALLANTACPLVIWRVKP